MKKLFFTLLLVPHFCFALQEKPWYGDIYEFHFRPQYNYNFFSKVDHGVPQLDSTFRTHVLAGALEVTIPECWSWELELEFADTSSVSWGYRSFAFQVRRLWLDDICGDCVSLSTGFVYRDASTRMREALSTPYHARANFEIHTAIGKEWNNGCYWVFRTFGVAAIGQGTEGFPWLRGDLFLLFNYQDQHQFRLYGQSYFGLGNRDTVFTDDFDGWAKIAHYSIDLGASYRYRFGCYGNLRFDYLYRVYAHSYPERVNFFIFTYDFPFSLF